VERLGSLAGGPARRRVVLLLAAVLALESADAGTVGAVAAQLERTFDIGNTGIGLLLTVSSLMGAASALPMGVVADRARRIPVLAISIGLWGLSMVATGFATSYSMVLVTRLALGWSPRQRARRLRSQWGTSPERGRSVLGNLLQATEALLTL
jgi:predicted MFS family arabinose efflux permease